MPKSNEILSPTVGSDFAFILYDVIFDLDSVIAATSVFVSIVPTFFFFPRSFFRGILGFNSSPSLSLRSCKKLVLP